MTPPPGRWSHLWGLDPAVAYLNHGSFGACPKAVLAHQSTLREELEREPVDFLWRSLPRRLRGAREALGRFVGADPDDLAFVPNATAGVNAVVRSLHLEPGDELLTTDHAYAACRKTLEHAAQRAGARVVVARVPFPVSSEEEVVAPLLLAVTPRTRLALVDHVTSPTALVFPVSRIVAGLRSRGVETLVDGAHAPGALPLDLSGLGAAYYTGNAHKWLCGPKGAAFLHVRRDLQRDVHPTAISHGFDPGSGGARFREEFEWTGTYDPTAVLSVPEAMRLLGELLPGGWPEVMATNRALARSARGILARRLGVELPCPDSMVASMASVPLPRPEALAPASRLDPEGLVGWCRERGFETWLHPWPSPGGAVVRVSAQLYNSEAQFEALAELLLEALRAS